ncbi:hypothetical protein GCM10011502_02030 [Oceanisphaera marina]|uniref:Reverse transcriptase domain-containing protein n=1 Tax=Oceanisphaera marina TaxID=2017550 RepID=A0ABQ1ID30_9GAMM|nr:hypothetical protein GCM10011502_02030 [Oceanisphaera marina]
MESGKRWVVDIDMEKFFDRVNHDILMSRISRVIKDKLGTRPQTDTPVLAVGHHGAGCGDSANRRHATRWPAVAAAVQYPAA